MKRYIIIAGIILIAILIFFTLYPYIFGVNNISTGSIKKGDHFRYLVTAENTNPNSFNTIDKVRFKSWFTNYLNVLNEKHANFVVLLYRSYEEYLKNWPMLLNFKQISSNSEDVYSAKGLLLAFNRFYIDLYILNDTGNYIKVNITLIFKDGVAKMGKLYAPTPKVDSKWIDNGDYYLSIFNELNISRIVSINKYNNDVTSNNINCGEWIFWLNKNDLKKKYTMMLYSMDDTLKVKMIPNATINGFSQVIFLNMSSKALYPYKLDGKLIPPTEQIYMNQGFIPPIRVFINISKENAGEIIKKLTEAFSKNKELKVLPKPIFKYSNGKLIVWENLFKLVDLSNKSWKLIFFPQQSMVSSNITTIYRDWGVKYHSKIYLSSGSYIDSISYSRNGILLYTNMSSADTDVFFITDIPSVITIPFSMASGYSFALKDHLIIKLIDIKPNIGISLSIFHAIDTFINGIRNLIKVTYNNIFTSSYI